MMTLCLVCCVLAVVLDAFALQIDRHRLWTRSGTYINHNDGRNEFWKSEPKPRHDTKVIIWPSLVPNIIFRKCVCMCVCVCVCVCVCARVCMCFVSSCATEAQRGNMNKQKQNIFININ